MAEVPINPIDLLIKSQQVALKLTTDVLRTVKDTAVTGVTAPDELVRQVGDLAAAVAGMATAVTGLAGATAQPLQDFIVRQRELADTVATLAEAQAELAGVVAKLADRHAEAVTALEKVTAPVFAIVGTNPTPPKTRASRQRVQQEMKAAASAIDDVEAARPARKAATTKAAATKAPAKPAAKKK